VKGEWRRQDRRDSLVDVRHDLPGRDLIDQGLTDLAAGAETPRRCSCPSAHRASGNSAWLFPTRFHSASTGYTLC
jgi:hypothetical protein